MDRGLAAIGTGIDRMHHLQGEGDTVKARVLPDQPGKVVIDKIEGDNGRLSLNAADNCIGIAAIETLKLIGQPSCGVALTLHKVRKRVAMRLRVAMRVAIAAVLPGGGMPSNAHCACTVWWVSFLDSLHCAAPVLRHPAAASC